MALNLQVSARTPITVPLAADPALVAANPMRADGVIPTLRYVMTGDCEGLVIPEGVSTATVRALTKDERREAAAAAGRMPDRGRRVYLRVIEEIQRRADAKDAVEMERRRDMLAKGLAWLADAAALPPDVREALARGLAAEAASIAAAEQLTAEPADEMAVREAILSDAEDVAYVKFSAWQRQHRRELARVGLVSLSDVPDIPPHPKGGYPVEALLQDENGEAVIEEVASHLDHVGTLGKAPPRFSACSSGESERASASGTSAPPETSAMDGSGATPEPASAVA